MHFLCNQVWNMSPHEDILSFLPDEGRAYPFFIEMAGTSYCDGSYRIERNDSPIYVLESVLQGRGTVVSGGETFEARAGDTYLMHRGSAHRYWSDEEDPWVKVWMNFRGPLADAILGCYGLGDVSHMPGLDLSDLFSDLLALAHASGGADGMLPEAAVLFHRMASRMHAHLRAGAAEKPGDAQALKDWLDAHIHSEASLRELAAQIYRSPSHAIRLFRRAFGVTPYEYLLQKQIETAKLLLLNTSLSVKEIAYRLCFSDEHYFSNYFKKRTGASPALYRAGASKNNRMEQSGQ